MSNPGQNLSKMGRNLSKMGRNLSKMGRNLCGTKSVKNGTKSVKNGTKSVWDEMCRNSTWDEICLGRNLPHSFDAARKIPQILHKPSLKPGKLSSEQRNFRA